MKKITAILGSMLLASGLSASSGAELAKKAGINPGTKAMKQWERYFSRVSYLNKKYPETKEMSEKQLEKLKEFCVNHAADSDSPAVAGF